MRCRPAMYGTGTFSWLVERSSPPKFAGFFCGGGGVVAPPPRKLPMVRDERFGAGAEHGDQVPQEAGVVQGPISDTCRAHTMDEARAIQDDGNMELATAAQDQQIARHSHTRGRGEGEAR